MELRILRYFLAVAAVMGENPSYFNGDNLSVENVTWYDAVEYCN